MPRYVLHHSEIIFVMFWPLQPVYKTFSIECGSQDTTAVNDTCAGLIHDCMCSEWVCLAGPLSQITVTLYCMAHCCAITQRRDDRRPRPLEHQSDSTFPAYNSPCRGHL